MKHSSRTVCASIIKGLYNEMIEYKNTVARICKTYRTNVEKAAQEAEQKYPVNLPPDTTVELFDNEARRMKQEARATETAIMNKYRSGFIDERKARLAPEAVGEIRRSTEEFHKKAREAVLELKKQLHDAKPVSSDFIGYARGFSMFGIKPSARDIDLLLEKADGNSLALRIVDSVIKSTKAPFSLKYKDEDSFDSDMAVLERLAGDDCFGVSEKCFAELLELFDGLSVSENDNSATIDRIRLSGLFALFSSDMEKLPAMFAEPEDGKTDSWLTEPRVEKDVSIELLEKSAAGAAENKETLDRVMKAYGK